MAVIAGYGYYRAAYPQDPFGAPPRGASPNCGPEERYKFDVTIDSKEDFINFLKTHEISHWVRLENFKDAKSEEVDWGWVMDAAKTENTGFRTFYVLNYNPLTCSGFTLKMTGDGHVSVYGCCGE